MFLLHIKKLLRNKGLAVLFFGYISGLIYWFLIREHIWYESVQGGLNIMIQALPYMFLIMLFVSYEMFSSLNRTDTMELVSNRRISLRAQKYDLTMLLSVILFSGVIVWISLKKNMENLGYVMAELDRYFGRISFIFVILPGLIAIMAGLCVSAFKNRTVAVCMLVAIFYVFDSSFHQLVMGMDFKNDGFFKVGTLFTVFDTQTSDGALTDSFYLMSAENVHIFRGMFWICIMSAVVAGICRRKISAAVCTILTALFLIAFFRPSGAGYDPEIINGFDRWREPDRYYTMEKAEEIEEKYLKDEGEGFSILSYDIEISVMEDVLKAEVSLVPDRGFLDEYRFTLYHRYGVKSVRDQDGRKLDFEQTDDYIRVMPGGGEIKKLVFSYEGFSQHFYATTQGISLPFYFEYYPAAGWQRVFLRDRSNTCFTQELPEHNAYFKLKITYPKELKLYTNIEPKGESPGLWSRTASYSGNADGLSIFASPYLTDMYINGIQVVYSVIDEECSPYSRDNMEEYKAFFENKTFPEGTVYFAVPWNYDNVCFGEKQIVEKIYRVETDYERFKAQGNTYYIPTEEDEREMQKSMEMLEEY